MKITASIICFILFYKLLFTQTIYEKTFDINSKTTIEGITSTIDDYTIVCGKTLVDSFGIINHSDGYISKINEQGGFLFSKIFIDTLHGIELLSICTDIENNFVMTGRHGIQNTNGYWNSSSFFVMKTDSIGNLIWAKTYFYDTDEVGYKIKQVSDGSYVIVGYSDLGPSIFKIDNNGNIIWSRIIRLNVLYGTMFDFIEDDQGNLLITGGIGMVLFMKIDNAGNLVWDKSYRGNNLIGAKRIIEVDNNNLILVGTANSILTGSSRQSMMLMKINSNGDIFWIKEYYIDEDAWGYDVAQTDDNSFIITGQHDFSGAMNPPNGNIMLKTDSSGNVLWITNSETYLSDGDYPRRNSHIKILSANRGITYGKTYDSGYISMFDLDSLYSGCSNYINVLSGDIDTSSFSQPFIFNIYTDLFDSTFVPNSYTVNVTDSIHCYSCIETIANFDFNNDSTEIYFSNYSENADSYYWDFGDGKVDSLINPIHSYDSAGTYTVCLMASNNCSNDTFCLDVYADCEAPLAGFSFIDTSGVVYFFNNSTGNNLNWYWDFGDGTYSYQQNPIHVYDSAGVFLVNLLVFNLCDSNVIYDSISVTITTQSEVLSNLLQIYPNPTTDIITIKAEGIESVEVINLQGKQIYIGKETEIDLSTKPKGIYIIKVITDKQTITRKLIKQ